MATFGAIAATSTAILGVLEAAAASEPEFSGVAFSLFTTGNLQKAPADKLACSL